jgi:hypothetical protein
MRTNETYYQPLWQKSPRFQLPSLARLRVEPNPGKAAILWYTRLGYPFRQAAYSLSTSAASHALAFPEGCPPRLSRSPLGLKPVGREPMLHDATPLSGNELCGEAASLVLGPKAPRAQYERSRKEQSRSEHVD